MRRTVLSVLVTALALTACGTTKNIETQPSASISETTFNDCVINQGAQTVAPSTGTTFSTKKAGTLLVGSDTAYPPFESIEGGKAVGFDVDLINEIAKRINLKAEIQTAAFDTIFTALASHKYDVVVSAVTIKESRKQTVDFTDAYFKADQSLAVDTSKEPAVKGIDNLVGKKVGVQKNTTGADCADALKKQGKVGEVVAYDEIPTAFSDLSVGRVAAVLNDYPTSKRIVEQRKGSLAITQIIRTKEEYGIAVPKDNPNLREAINKALADMKKDGTYRTIFVRWFETEPPA